MRTIALLACLAASLAAEDRTLRLQDAEGNVVANLIPLSDGFRIVDEGGAVLGEARASEDRVRLVNERGEEVLSVVRQGFGAEVRQASGDVEYVLREEGGEWRVQDASGSDLGRFRLSEDGFELRTSDDQVSARITTREDRIRFEDGSGALKSELRSTSEARAWIWLALDRLSVAERVAIATWFLKVTR